MNPTTSMRSPKSLLSLMLRVCGFFVMIITLLATVYQRPTRQTEIERSFVGKWRLETGYPSKVVMEFLPNGDAMTRLKSNSGESVSESKWRIRSGELRVRATDYTWADLRFWWNIWCRRFWSGYFTRLPLYDYRTRFLIMRVDSDEITVARCSVSEPTMAGLLLSENSMTFHASLVAFRRISHTAENVVQASDEMQR